MAGYTLDNAFIWPDKAHIAFSNEIIIARDRPTRCINYMPALFVATRRRINGSINYVDDAVASRIDAENTDRFPYTSTCAIYRRERRLILLREKWLEEEEDYQVVIP